MELKCEYCAVAVGSVEMGHERCEGPMLVVDKDKRMSRNGRRIETSEGIVDK